MKQASLTVIAVLVILASLTAFAALYMWKQPRAYTETALWVKTGWGQAQIADEIGRLAGLPPLAVHAGLRLSALKPFHAGEYDLAATPSLAALSRAMQAGQVIKRSVTIPEGLTSYQILAKIKTSFGVTDDCPDYRTVPEGTALPETYAYTRGDACTAILKRMQGALAAKLDDLWARRDQTVPYVSMREALVMASIVERETGVAAERPRVAGVFVNRLRLGMPLQSDPTTIYGLSNGTGDLGRELTRADWKIPTPFNTYTIPALPPTPIAHPGLASIEAALHPEPNEFLFFVANGTGGHAFSKTLDEHNKNTINR